MDRHHLEYIGDAKINNVDVCVFRDVNGKWWVKCDGITTQNRLNCAEIVRYLLNAANNCK